MKYEYLDIFGTKLHDQLQKIMVDIQDASKAEEDAHKVERNIHESMRVIGFNLLEYFFSLSGDGDQGSEIIMPDGHSVRKLNEIHTRLYRSIYGEHLLKRAVYGTREGQKIEWVPLDAKLNLPESKFSYLLQDWDQSLVVEFPYARVNETIEKILGFKQSVNSLERVNQKMSTSAGDFWEKEVPVPPKEKESEIFVCSVDGKGVPIRKDKSVQNPEVEAVDLNPFDSQDKSEKKGRKKMALVGAVYTIDPYIRTPADIIESLFRENDKRQKPTLRPKPMYKHIRASLLRDGADTSRESYDEIFGWIADEEKNRNSDAKKDVVCIMDGQDSLWRGIVKATTNKNIVEIIDLIHVCGYIWNAAHLFYNKKTPEAANFARTRLLRILEGDVLSVVRGLVWKGTHEKLSKEKLRELDTICGYLRNNTHGMKYDEYLTAGYPIASGVIEGACRYVVKDRMERSGMSWILQGAHAMLGLRCIKLSGYWEEFMNHRIKQECERIYPWRSRICANDDSYDCLKTG
jgi:hypothetical protein